MLICSEASVPELAPFEVKGKAPAGFMVPRFLTELKNNRGGGGFLSSQELSEDHCSVIRGDVKDWVRNLTPAELEMLPKRAPDFVVNDLRTKLSKPHGRFE